MANLSQKERDALPAEDFAGPDRSFPITDQEDVDSAAHLIGKAADPEAVKAAILAICKRKGLKPPDAWTSEKKAAYGGDTAPASGMEMRSWNGQYCCFGENSDSPMPGSCHDTPAACQEWMHGHATGMTGPPPGMMGKAESDGLLVYAGGTVKALGNNRIGGYLVTFHGEGDRSEYKDIFTPETDFVAPFPQQLPVMFFHGTTKAYRKRCLGLGTATPDDTGVRFEATVTDPALYQKAEAGELAWSSGAAGHTVEREALPGGRHRVLTWLMSEASVAPRDAVMDGRNAVLALKALVTDDPDAALECARSHSTVRSLAERTELWLDTGEDLLVGYRQVADGQLKAGRVLSASRLERLQRAFTLLQEIITEASPRDEATGDAGSGRETQDGPTPDAGGEMRRELQRLALSTTALSLSEA